VVFSRPRFATGLALALALASGGILVPGGAPVALAGGGLVTVMDASYVVQPENALVHVTIDAVSTSFEDDAPEGPVYYAGLSFSIPPGSRNVTATAGGESLETTVTPGADQVRVDVGFSEQVFLGDDYAYQITFDMIDQGGAADRDFRIGHSVVAFPVWAFGSPEAEGGSVAVVLPPTFSPSVYGGPLIESVDADGTVRLTADVSNSPSWFAYVTAERPGVFTATPFTVLVGDIMASVIVQAWDDDPEWGVRTIDLLTGGLPALYELIGLPWPVVSDLKVEESANRLGDYAGIYNSQTETINVRYDADGTVTLHEAAHIWFNNELFAERWIGEAWAEFYAVHSADAIGVTGETFGLTDDLLAAQIPLNDWEGIGVEAQNVEAFAYAASYYLAERIFERTDHDGLRAVWLAAANDELAYQPIHSSDEPRTGVARAQEGWQRLLDLLEERTGVAYDDLWVAWVVDPEEEAMLAERSEARARYVEVLADAGPWELPEQIRYAMGSWQFDEATAELDTADRVLALAGELDTLADELSLDPPDQLEAAFEGTGGLQAALTEANKELFALELVADATRGLATEPEPLDWIGLLLAEPADDLEAARLAWEAGDHGSATDHAEAVLTTLDEADDRGRERVAIAGALMLLGVGGVTLAARRRRKGHEPPPTATDEPPAPEPPAPEPPFEAAPS
jgi:hypothetical protein